MQSLSDIISATFSEPPEESPRGSPSPQHASQTLACEVCSNQFSISRLRHVCRKCGAIVCGMCSQGRVRLVPGGDKQRVCQLCEQDVRATNIDEMEENADVRMQINTSLRVLLKDKYEEIEQYKKQLIQLVNSEDLLKEPPSIEGPSRFDVSRGPDRVNFVDIVKYLDGSIQRLTKEYKELSQNFESESASIRERRSNFLLLQNRTQIAETNAEAVKELVKQRNRLKDTYMQQEATLRALQDRVEMMEQRLHQRTARVTDNGHFYVEEDALVGDHIADRVFPCLKIA